MALVLPPSNLLTLASIGNGLLLVINAVIFVSILQQLKRVNRKEQDFSLDYSDKLLEANTKAAALIHAAADKAQSLFADSQINLKEIRSAIEEDLNEVAADHHQALAQAMAGLTKDYKQFIVQLGSQLKTDTSGLVTQVISQAQTEIQGFVHTLKQETVAAQGRFESQLRDEFTKAMTDIKAYREEQLGLVEKTINQIILRVSKTVLPEAISITEHERLIFDALEKAKKEEVLQDILND